MASEQDGADWPRQIADQVEHYVTLVHDTVTVKVVKAVRAAVFGILCAVVGVVALVVFVVLLVRLLSMLFFGRVWLAHLLTGLLFIVAGAFLMRMRHRPSTES